MEAVSSVRVISMGFSVVGDSDEGDGDKMTEGIR